jgi:hypothetical protein
MGENQDHMQFQNLELFSIHIPKTAGITFREVLYSVYGRDKILAVNRAQLRKQGRAIDEVLEAHHRVIHGHLHFNDLAPFLPVSTKVVAWMREPVQRVVSNYYYNITHEYPKRKLENPDAVKLTLEEFIEKPGRINVMSKFLEGIDLNELFFLGFQEDFASDLERLQMKLEWPRAAVDSNLRLNDNRAVKKQAHEVERHIIDRIAELNQKDINLYHSALEFKKSGRWQN